MRSLDLNRGLSARSSKQFLKACDSCFSVWRTQAKEYSCSHAYAGSFRNCVNSRKRVRQSVEGRAVPFSLASAYSFWFLARKKFRFYPDSYGQTSKSGMYREGVLGSTIQHTLLHPAWHEGGSGQLPAYSSDHTRKHSQNHHWPWLGRSAGNLHM